MATADLLIETERPGVMAERGLGYEALSLLRPQLVMLSITPFGQSGPYAQYEAEDIVALALGGMLYLGGYPDTAPMRVHGDQAILCANMYGAVAGLLALLQTEMTGRGEHIDVSMQESVVLAWKTRFSSTTSRERCASAGPASSVSPARASIAAATVTCS